MYQVNWLLSHLCKLQSRIKSRQTTRHCFLNTSYVKFFYSNDTPDRLNVVIHKYKYLKRNVLAQPLNLAAMSGLRSGFSSQTQDVLYLPGVSWNRFLKETAQEDVRNKNCTMKRLLHGTLRLRNSPTSEQIQNGRTTDEIPRDPISPWCSPPPFCPCVLLCRKFRNFLLRNKALVYLLTW